MKNITLSCLMLCTAFATTAQPKTKVYPLRVYLQKNHPALSFTFFEAQGNKLPLLITGLASPDSLTFLLPEGNIIIGCSFNGKHVRLGLQKRPMPDTIYFHQ